MSTSSSSTMESSTSLSSLSSLSSSEFTSQSSYSSVNSSSSSSSSLSSSSSSSSSYSSSSSSSSSTSSSSTSSDESSSGGVSSSSSSSTSSNSSSTSSSNSSSSSSSSSSADDYTIGNIIDRIRYLVNDRSASRWVNSDILTWVNDGVLRIRNARPDCKLNSTGNLISFSKYRSTATLWEYDNIWAEAVVNYACYRLLAEEAEDKLSFNRSNMFKQLFDDNIRS